MNIIHIFTEVKHQSFSDLAKTIERKRHSESGYLAIEQSLDEALGFLEEYLTTPTATTSVAGYSPGILSGRSSPAGSKRRDSKMMIFSD